MRSRIRTSLRGVLATTLTLSSLALAACTGPMGTSAKDDRDNGAVAGNSDGTNVGNPQATGGPPRCTEATAEAQLQPVYVLFVVDGSGSMGPTNPGGTDGNWNAIVPPIDQIVDMVAAKNDRTVGIGMIGFADSKDPTGAQGVYGPYPQAADVPIRFVDGTQAAALKERLNTTPKGITPTQAALEGGYALLRSFTPGAPLQPGGRKVLVLITDGFPASNLANFTCPPTDGLCTQIQMANSIQMAEQASHDANDPILTFAVGVGSFPGDGVDYDPVFLGRLAEAGGTKRTPTCNPYENSDENNVCHIQITPGMKTPDQLREEAFQAINAIRDKTLACDFDIKAPPTGFSLDNHTATVRQKLPDGSTRTILPSTSNGWSFDDAKSPKRVFLNGDACRQYRQLGGTVQVVLACK